MSRDGAESASVGELCRRDPVAVSADDEVKIAREVMRANHLEHLPVVDAEGKALGVITAEDLDQASGS